MKPLQEYEIKIGSFYVLRNEGEFLHRDVFQLFFRISNTFSRYICDLNVMNSDSLLSNEYKKETLRTICNNRIVYPIQKKFLTEYISGKRYFSEK